MCDITLNSNLKLKVEKVKSKRKYKRKYKIKSIIYNSDINDKKDNN